jgi:hypothetical protein
MKKKDVFIVLSPGLGMRTLPMAAPPVVSFLGGQGRLQGQP